MGGKSVKIDTMITKIVHCDPAKINQLPFYIAYTKFFNIFGRIYREIAIFNIVWLKTYFMWFLKIENHPLSTTSDTKTEQKCFMVMKKWFVSFIHFFIFCLVFILTLMILRGSMLKHDEEIQ